MGCLSVPWRKALSTNSTSTGFTAQVTTTTEPTGTGVLDLLSESLGWGAGAVVPTYVQLIPFGTDGANDTFDMRLWGFHKIAPGTAIYVPELLIDISVILGAATATDIAANTLLADTITVNDGAADNGPWRSFVDAQEDLVASVLVHTKGCRYLKFDWDLAGGQEAASMNCLIRPFEF